MPGDGFREHLIIGTHSINWDTSFDWWVTKNISHVILELSNQLFLLLGKKTSLDTVFPTDSFYWSNVLNACIFKILPFCSASAIAENIPGCLWTRFSSLLFSRNGVLWKRTHCSLTIHLLQHVQRFCKWFLQTLAEFDVLQMQFLISKDYISLTNIVFLTTSHITGKISFPLFQCGLEISELFENLI